MAIVLHSVLGDFIGSKFPCVDSVLLSLFAFQKHYDTTFINQHLRLFNAIVSTALTISLLGVFTRTSDLVRLLSYATRWLSSYSPVQQHSVLLFLLRCYEDINFYVVSNLF